MKTLMRITTVLLIISLNYYTSKSCIWIDSPDSYRASMFKPEIEALKGYRAFYYTPRELNTYLPRHNNDDRYANCKEWQKALGEDCKIDDIFEMLYGMDKQALTNFLKEGKTFFDTHKDNSFIAALSKNGEWKLYFMFSKLNEVYNSFFIESWDVKYANQQELKNNIEQIAATIFSESKNKTIIERTAFHLLRLAYLESNYKKCMALYEKYFTDTKSKSVVNDWAKLYYAESLYIWGRQVEANLMYAQIFASSEEKRIRAYRLFDFDFFDKTLAFAQTPQQKATLWAMKAIHTPGPALKYIKNVVSNNFKNKVIPLLIMREVNKMEDWIFTPEIAGCSPSLHPEESSLIEDNDDQETIKRKNKIADLEYLKKFKLYLKKISPMLGSQLKDYLLVARAHLALIERQNKEALSLFRKVSYNAEKPILVQRSTELALYYVFEDKIESKKVQTQLVSTLKDLESIAKKDNFYYKYLYSVTKLISNEYLRKNNIVMGGLFRGKSGFYSRYYDSEGTSHRDYSYYNKISFFDKYAKIKDVDNLMKLISKKNKSTFEKYLCNQDLASIGALLDLKGTIALRQNDIQTAYEAFSKAPHDFWEKTYEFSTYLDSDPFIILFKQPKKKEKYNFNKADVVKQLLEYKKEADNNNKNSFRNYMQVANFFYNSAYNGNSWMMLSYWWSEGETQYYSGLISEQKNFENSFFKYEIALHYYNKAESFATTPEEKARILLMKHLCKYYKYSYIGSKEAFNPEDVRSLYRDYKDTEFFKEVNCPTLELFVGD